MNENTIQQMIQKYPLATLTYDAYRHIEFIETIEPYIPEILHAHATEVRNDVQNNEYDTHQQVQIVPRAIVEFIKQAFHKHNHPLATYTKTQTDNAISATKHIHNHFDTCIREYPGMNDLLTPYIKELTQLIAKLENQPISPKQPVRTSLDHIEQWTEKDWYDACDHEQFDTYTIDEQTHIMRTYIRTKTQTTNISERDHPWSHNAKKHYIKTLMDTIYQRTTAHDKRSHIQHASINAVVFTLRHDDETHVKQHLININKRIEEDLSQQDYEHIDETIFLRHLYEQLLRTQNVPAQTHITQHALTNHVRNRIKHILKHTTYVNQTDKQLSLCDVDMQIQLACIEAKGATATDIIMHTFTESDYHMALAYTQWATNEQQRTPVNTYKTIQQQLLYLVRTYWLIKQQLHEYLKNRERIKHQNAITHSAYMKAIQQIKQTNHRTQIWVNVLKLPYFKEHIMEYLWTQKRQYPNELPHTILFTLANQKTTLNPFNSVQQARFIQEIIDTNTGVYHIERPEFDEDITPIFLHNQEIPHITTLVLLNEGHINEEITYAKQYLLVGNNRNAYDALLKEQIYD